MAKVNINVIINTFFRRIAFLVMYLQMCP